MENNVKSEIIKDLLISYVQNLSKGYSEYFKINDCEIISDYEFSMYIDSIYKLEDVNNINIYKIYLKDFELKCKEFISELGKEIPLEHFVFDEIFYDEEELNGGYYYCCELQFKIKNSEEYC